MVQKEQRSDGKVFATRRSTEDTQLLVIPSGKETSVWVSGQVTPRR